MYGSHLREIMMMMTVMMLGNSREREVSMISFLEVCSPFPRLHGVVLWSPMHFLALLLHEGKKRHCQRVRLRSFLLFFPSLRYSVITRTTTITTKTTTRTGLFCFSLVHTKSADKAEILS